MRIEVVFSAAPRQVEVVPLELPDGATLRDAVEASGLLSRHPHFGPQSLSLSVWGRPQPAEHPLREGDRVELCRGLLVDPKEARRLRYKGQGGAKKKRA
ncbi:RnfH family protein [Azohydromonas aeria]|uniref:RnfH family protein n=1 Tax=Azohydromonas aeria TaxID=2590212 RepID=UPI0012F75FFE|nr:RnfH family protein [Azohydromonas aeria]